MKNRLVPWPPLWKLLVFGFVEVVILVGPAIVLIETAYSHSADPKNFIVVWGLFQMVAQTILIRFATLAFKPKGKRQ